MPEKPRRIAAIDVGTNSIHMIVAEAHGSRGYRVVDREKDMVQLGLSSLDGQPLTDAAVERGVMSIARMAEIAARWEAEEIIAVATSAVREAPNRREFLRLVREASGVKLRVISGEEEADYIFRAVRSAVDIGGSTAACIDVGGGSAEVIVGTLNEIYFTASEPLGSLRLSQRFHLGDRPTSEAVAGCRRHVADRASRLRKRVKRIGVDMAIGTSGTILALAALCAGDATSNALKCLTRTRLTDIINRLALMTAAERSETFGIDGKRAATILGGALALEGIMAALSIESLLACPVAIREGIIESRIATRHTSPGRAGSLRRKSVRALAERTDCDVRHGQHVSRLAARIFDQTRDIHGLADEARELLEHAAMLHESGAHISNRGHHKHSYYLIRHAELKGFTEEQLLVVANVARYYRKSPPDASHENFLELNDAQRATVEKLAAILRIAEGLDRGHRQRVRDVAVRNGGRAARFVARARADASVELESAEKRSKYFGRLFNMRVAFEVL
ncbi:MAG TPA: Ppx/GppA phosphatase family protein [Thermoanaerobaculia bacterium]|nr:Ppx/GppA phosphatase family protein [Thermoanaerobaculia bacterium]